MSVGKSEPIRSITWGKVYRYSDDPDNITNLGKFVELRHIVTIGGSEYSFYSVYAMLSWFSGSIQMGERMASAHETIGYSGPTGPMQDILKNSTFWFGIYTLEESVEFSNHFKAEPDFAQGVYWYNQKA